jgi:hypothetical protein
MAIWFSLWLFGTLFPMLLFENKNIFFHFEKRSILPQR